MVMFTNEGFVHSLDQPHKCAMQNYFFPIILILKVLTVSLSFAANVQDVKPHILTRKHPTKCS